MKIHIRYTVDVPIDVYYMLVRYAEILGYHVKTDDKGRSAVVQLLTDQGRNALMQAADHEQERLKNEEQETT